MSERMISNLEWMVRVFVFLAVLAVLGLLTGCNATLGSPDQPTATLPATPTVTCPVDVISADNAYRQQTGQPLLQPGLACQVYNVPSTTTSIQTAVLGQSQSFIATSFSQPNCLGCTFNVLPVALQPVYQDYFIIKCTGVIGLNGSDYHNFTLISDDGSILTVDGQTVVNNDGRHGVVTATNSTYLTYGVHTIEVDYYQYNGPFALMVWMDGFTMGAFYH